MTANGGIGVPWRRIALAVFAVLLIAALGYWHLRPEPTAEAAAPVAAEPEPPLHLPPPAARTPPPPVARTAPPAVAAPKSPAAPESVAKEEPADAGELYLTQLPRGDGGGLDAFPRPGTKPVLRGIVVPDGFDLPEGYVRHVQVTDDGRELPPILMFHPDYHPPGVEIPKDRVVPENLAPPGMPVQWLDPPPVRTRE